jgi:hypothetical protein
MSHRSERHSTLLLAARQSPDFALRALAVLGPEARAELLRRWCVTPPLAHATARTARAPQLRKCSPNGLNATGLGAQLEAFARTVRRVG